MTTAQAQLLNPSYNLQQSNISLGRPQPQGKIYATSQVNVFPGNPQRQYFVTSTRPSQQANGSFKAQALSTNQLNAFNNQNPIPYSVYLSQNNKVASYTEKKQSESRITYHPYVRTYIDYEERVVLVPVERVKINYYEKVYQTQYVPQAIEEIITETVPVEKDVLKVQYIPVQQQIIHFPKEQKKVQSAGQAQRKIIYYDARGQQVTKSRHQAVLKSNFTNFVTTSQQNFVPHGQFQRTAVHPQPIHSTFNPNITGVSQAQIIKSQNESEIYLEEPQIFLNEGINETKKKLGESHVKSAFAPNYNPKNEPIRSQ